jgi:hypothetical protein
MPLHEWKDRVFAAWMANDQEEMTRLRALVDANGIEYPNAQTAKAVVDDMRYTAPCRICGQVDGLHLGGCQHDPSYFRDCLAEAAFEHRGIVH